MHEHVVLGSANVMWTWFSDQLPFPTSYNNCVEGFSVAQKQTVHAQ